MADSAGARGPLIRIEVAYALPERQELVTLEVETGTTAREAIERSGLIERYPAIALDAGSVGIFGKPVPLDQKLREGDRVEIYRPLTADPKSARRVRAGNRRRR